MPENEGTEAAASEPMKKLVVRSENDAFRLLKKALENELADQPYALEFENWPILTLRYVGEGYDSTITPQIAESLVELQHTMNRSFARLVKHSSNANVLTKEERQSLEFKAKVDEGSSLITVDMGEFAQTLTTALAGKMTGTELVIAILGLAVTAGSTLAYKAFLAARSDDKKVDQDTKQLVSLSEQETKRMQILSDALNKNSALKATHEDFDNVRHDFVKSVGDATHFGAQGISLTKDQARVIALTPRAKADAVQLNGNYRIEKIDWSKEAEVRISLFGVDAERREFVASMTKDNLTGDHKEKLKSCEWDGVPVYLSINATVLRGEVTTAVIVGVEWPKQAREAGSGQFGATPAG